jgi:tRNA (guanosine-2'-O-)-methyltransferase
VVVTHIIIAKAALDTKSITNFQRHLPQRDAFFLNTMEYKMRPERKEKMEEVLHKRQPDLVLVMENIEDPHNIGAVLRTADSVGVQEIFVINTLIGVHEFRKKRSSGSADKWLSITHFDSVEKCVAALRQKGLQIWATHLGAEAISLYSLDLCQPIALVFGRERGGLSQEMLQQCDGNFIIPQVGMIQSLNVSVACAVSLYEAYRQRAHKGLQSEYSAQGKELILKEWCKQYDK